MNIILTGMMGVGKTTIGKRLAQKLDLEFLDLDDYIQKKTHLTIPQIFSEHGEPYFRRIEKKFCNQIAQKNNAVISTGGKTLLDKENLNSLSSSGIIITLLSSPDKILLRIKGGASKRPLLNSPPAESLYKIYRQRKHHYLNLPNKIDTTSLHEKEVVDEIVKLIKGESKRYEMDIREKKSSVIIKTGLSQAVCSYLKDIVQEKRVFILSDKNVFGVHGKTLLKELERACLKYSVFLLCPGESQKNLKTAEKVYSWLLKDKASRSSLLISFGGGVVSDVGGYVASTFHRGINLVNIPTTLLAQIDASIGGKNGINLNQAKNQIGTFYAPSLVMIDPLFLVSLDPRHMKEGTIEAIKAGVIADRVLFETIKKNARQILLKDMKSLEEVINRAIQVKLDIVNQDPYEKGKRKILNLGHTFGHALESYFNYEKITHGQAVGLGMICAGKMARLMKVSKEDLLSEIKEILHQWQMPLHLKNLDISKILSLMEYDKKRKEDSLSFVIPKRIGEAVTVKNVSKNIIHNSLMEISHG
ncbi:MAG: 3-dehydroquinate synthase [Candidatus Aminicenantes bacterium]